MSRPEAALALVLVVLLVPGCTESRPGSAVRIVYASSGTPAAGVVVEAGRDRALTDGAGNAVLARAPSPEEGLLVRDPRSGLVLYSGSPAPVVEVAAPVRLHVDVSEFGLSTDVEVHVGTGPDVPVESVHFALTHQRVPRVDPLDLPPIASVWQVLEPGPACRFYSSEIRPRR